MKNLTLFILDRKIIQNILKNCSQKKNYPKDPQIVPYPLATLKLSHTLMSWTCAGFFKTE